MLRKISLLILFVLIVAGCVNTYSANDSILFVKDQSIANLVEVEDRLLTVEFVVINNSDRTIGPFTIEIKAFNEELIEMLEQDFGNMGEQYTLQQDEKHVYGGTALVNREISADQLRSAIEDNNSLEVQLLDESGELIASEWITKLIIIQ